MNILYCGDENVCGGIYLSAVSVRRNTCCRLDFYILTASLKDEHRAIPAEFAEKIGSMSYLQGIPTPESAPDAQNTTTEKEISV